MKALIWLRVSTNKQNEATQLPDILAYCQFRGYEIADTIVVHGESAFHGEQDPYWTKAVEADADVIVLWKVDRLDRRNLLVAVPMVNRALEVGKRVEFATQQFIDLTNMQGRIAFAMFCEMAYEESKIKSDRIKSTHADLRARGSFAHGNIMVGYDIEVRDGIKILVPNDLAPLVREAFELAAEGLSMAKIEARVPGLGLTDSGIIRMIRHPVYRGQVQYKGVAYASAEPIVSSALWLRANQAINAKGQSRGHGSRGRPSSSQLFPKCECSRPMYRYLRHYRCLTKGGCRNSIEVDVLDTEVLAEFLDDNEPEIAETVVPGRDWAEEIAKATLQIRDLDLLADDYDERHRALVAELRRLTSLEAEPEKRTAVYTGRTEGDAFREMTPDERQAFTRLWTLTVWREDSEHQNALVAALHGRRWTLSRVKA